MSTNAFQAGTAKTVTITPMIKGPSAFDPDYIVRLSAAEEAYYRDVLHYDDAGIATLETKRTAEYHDLHTKYGSISTSYNASWHYTPTAAEVNAIKATIHVYTEKELLFAMNAGLLKPVAKTQTTIEDPNLKGRNVTLVTGDGVGSATGQEVIVTGTLGSLTGMTPADKGRNWRFFITSPHLNDTESFGWKPTQ